MDNIIPLKMRLESAELEQSALIELYIIDLTKINGDVLRFHSGKNELLNDLVWQGQTYGAHPVQGSGFEFNGSGKSNRPSLTFSNIDGFLTGLTQDYQDLVGAVVIRKLVYARYMDAENFIFGNPSADPSQEVNQRYLIEQLDSINETFASFKLAIPAEMDGSIIPKRQITANTCLWSYRKDECPYRGGPVADELNKPTNDPTKDQCSKSIKGCKLRFGENSPLPFGGFPSISR